MLRIRRFVQGDAETYLGVLYEGFSTEVWWEVKRQDVSKLDFDAAFFAELESQAVGLVAIEIHEDEAYIKWLVVLENFRRKGIGTKIIEKAIEFSKSKGTKRIRAS